MSTIRTPGYLGTEYYSVRFDTDSHRQRFIVHDGFKSVTVKQNKVAFVALFVKMRSLIVHVALMTEYGIQQYIKYVRSMLALFRRSPYRSAERFEALS